MKISQFLTISIFGLYKWDVSDFINSIEFLSLTKHIYIFIASLSSLFREPKSTANREKEPENAASKLSDSLEPIESITDSTDDDEKSDDENESAKSKGVKRKKRSNNRKSSKKSKKLGAEFEESFLRTYNIYFFKSIYILNVL